MGGPNLPDAVFKKVFWGREGPFGILARGPTATLLRHCQPVRSRSTASRTDLDEHLGSGAELGRPERLAEAAHRLAIARELERELLLPRRLDGSTARRAEVLARQARLVGVEHVHLFDQHRQRRLRRLADLLVDALRLNDATVVIAI